MGREVVNEVTVMTEKETIIDEKSPMLVFAVIKNTECPL